MTMMAGPNGQPIFILRDGTERTTGRTAQHNNIAAAMAVADAVRTTLGPMGMDKLLVSGGGENVLITNDGATILREIDIDHPTAKLVIEVSKNQEEKCFDGTTSAVVIAGELLKEAEGLLQQQIHPTIIARGYRMASQEALKELENLGWGPTGDDFFGVAHTALTGKSAEAAIEVISKMCVEAVGMTADGETFDMDNVKVLSFEGGAYDESALLPGVLVEKEKLHSTMPTEIEEANILLLMSAIEVKKTKTDMQFNVNDPSQVEKFLAQEEKAIKEMVDSIIESGANVVVCNKDVDDLAAHYLAKAGVYCIKRVKKSDMESLHRLTGASLVNDDIGMDALGSCSLKEVKFGEHRCTLIEKEGARTVTAILRGSTGHSVDEIERAFDDALGVVGLAFNDGTLVAGGGAIHAWLSYHLRKLAASKGGRVGMAIEAFANALEVIPRTLAENAGLDPVDTILDLRKHESFVHGVSTEDGIVDMIDEGVIEPRSVISNAISAATEASVMVLRIDDVISMKGGAPPAPPQMGM